jgi:L-threonylcarbamoyladenylate synthase
MIGLERQNMLDCARPSDILNCAAIVRGGGIIVFPTDTVYGIGCDPFNHMAVKRIFDIKGRERNNPLPVLAATVDCVRNIARMDTVASTLARKYWPGRLTIVCPLGDNRISSLVSANSGTIAVRIPGNKCTMELLSECRYLVGTSANRSGEGSIRDIRQIVSSPLRGLDGVLSGGYLAEGKESTIVDVSKQGHPCIIRKGAIASDEIFETLYSEGLIDKNL